MLSQATCRICGKEFDLPAYKAKKGDHRCAPCVAAYMAQWKVRTGRGPSPTDRPARTPGLCTKCDQPFEVTPAKARRSDYRCRACVNKANNAYRAAHGRKTYDNPQARAQRFQADYADPVKRAKHKARTAARHAIKRGQLARQPCEVCGDHKVEAHHDDYSQPLSVRWLCPTHHRAHHATERALAAA